MSDKNEVSTTENVAPQPGKRAALKRHCARFWWIHLIIFLLISVFVVLISIFVAVPRIAQSKINGAKLDIIAVKITNPTPDSYHMTINSTIATDGSVKANIDPFEGAMYLEDAPDQTPFATIQFPATHAAKFSHVNLDQDIQIKNMDAFKQFNTWFINNETLRIAVKGNTKVQPSGLNRKYPVVFYKVLETKGLNRFKGIKVTDPIISLSLDDGTDPKFRNFQASTVLPNPSHFTLDIGNVTFDNSFLGTHLGKLYIDNLFLSPGENTFHVSGNIRQTTILPLVAGHRPYCETGVAPFSLVGTNVTYNGAELEYFTHALANANQTIDFNLDETLKNSNIPINITCTDIL